MPVIVCSELGCKNKVKVKPGVRYVRCRVCREMAARLEALHRPPRMLSEEELAARREERIRARVGC